MNIAAAISRPLYWLAGKVFSLWARPVVQPEVPFKLITDSSAAICYVLETGGLADLLALEKACATHGLPRQRVVSSMAGLATTNGSSYSDACVA